VAQARYPGLISRKPYYIATLDGMKDSAALNKLAVIQSAIAAFEAVIFSGRPEPEDFVITDVETP
jgi:hypothetical protein